MKTKQQIQERIKENKEVLNLIHEDLTQARHKDAIEDLLTEENYLNYELKVLMWVLDE